MTTDYRLKAAKEAAAKVNAMLVATGQLRPSDLNKGRAKPGKSSDLFVEEVVINDAPMSARNFLTRSFTQEEISKMSGASVSTRGRYMTQEEIDSNTSNDRPLYLHIQGINQQDVKVAVGRIMHLIMEHTHRKGNSHHKGKGHRTSSGQNAGGGSRQGDRSPKMDKTSTENIEPIVENKIYSQNVLREKVFLPSTVNLNPVEIRIRLAGDNNSNIKYIQDETRATIFMRGIGSGFIEPLTGMESQEALHFYLEHQNQDQFNQAKDLVVNLAQTILSQIHQEQQSQEHIPPPPVIQQHGFQQSHLNQIPLNGGSVIPPPLPAIPPQIQAGNQAIVPTITQQVPPGMIPTQLGVPVNPVQLPQTPSQLLIPTQVQASSTVPSQSIQELQPASVTHGAQLLQISVPSSVGGPNLVSQQLVQTSAGPQLVHLPHGTQIVSTLEGPRLVSLTPVSSASTAFITQSIQSTVADQQPLGVAISQTVPQPLPQPVPQPVPHPLPQNCNVSGFGQGETYMFDSEQRKFPSSPVIMTSTPNTFAYIPQEPLQQAVVPTTTLPVEISQAQQWHQPTNSVVISQVCTTPSVADVTFAQASHTQATFARPNVNHTSENFPCGDISNHLLTDSMRPNSEWNIEIGGKTNPTHYLETSNSTSEVSRENSSFSKERDDSSLVSESNRHISDQRSPLKTSQYLWAQYPNISYGPHDKSIEEAGKNETYNIIDGGSQQNEKEPKNSNSSSETFVKDDTLQGTRHVPRNSPSSGGFSGEPKRRRSFKPKGDFHGANRMMKREHDKPFPNRPLQVPLNEQFYHDDVNLRASFDYSPSTSKMTAYSRSMRREDFHMRNRGEIGTYYGDPNMEKMRNPWIWNRNDRIVDPIAGPSQSSNYNHRSKVYDSPWESGIPGLQIGKDVPRSNEPIGNRNKFPKKKFNRLY